MSEKRRLFLYGSSLLGMESQIIELSKDATRQNTVWMFVNCFVDSLKSSSIGAITESWDRNLMNLFSLSPINNLDCCAKTAKSPGKKSETADTQDINPVSNKGVM
jgi:hypothetical protein